MAYMDDDRRKRISLFMSTKGLRAIDANKGAWTRSEYIRQALNRAIKQGFTGPASTLNE